MGKWQGARQKIPLRQRSITVLVPVLNEVENIERTVERLVEALSITVEDFEIIIIDDGSTDGSGDLADKLAASNPALRVIRNSRNMGLGYCYTLGYKEATKEFYVYIPGDNTWPYRSFVELLGNITRADVITSYAINPEVRPLGRRIVSRLYTQVLNFLFGYRLQYFNGLTIYPVEFMHRNPVTTFGFGFQAEVLAKALSSGLSYIEVGLPIDERSSGASKAVNPRNIISVALSVVRLFYELRIRKRWRPAGGYATTMSLQGAAVSIEELGFAPDEDFVADPAANPEQTPKIIVVAGASSGLGAALARDLADAGHQVFACSRSLDRLQAALGSHSNIHLFACDVTDESAVAEFVTAIVDETDYVDVLLNCAGGFGAVGTIDKVVSKDWIRTVNDNLFGTFLTIKQFLPLLECAEAPQVLNFAGGGAFSPFPHYSAYACSKASIVRLTETLALELMPRGIAVNAIAPGLIRTRIHEATIAAGPEKAGRTQFRRTERLMEQNDDQADAARVDTVQRCVRALISTPYHGLTGKTISANFDPWSSEVFRQNIVDITRSELYTMRRTNLANLPEGFLRSRLMKAWAKHLVRR